VTAVRPEHVLLEAAGRKAAGPGEVDATLLAVAPLGETVQYQLRLDDGHPLLARRPAPEAPDLRVGERVRCRWSAEHVRFFPAEQLADIPGPESDTEGAS
jgi:spermidine/putrescine transport system ATP-binding protein